MLLLAVSSAVVGTSVVVFSMALMRAAKNGEKQLERHKAVR